MPIDRIGSPGMPPAATPALSPDSARRSAADRTAIDPSAAAPAVAPPPLMARGALELLRSGSISLDGYLDLKVNEATSHLVMLPPAQLESVRAALRERLMTDPTLVDLVRTAAAGAPPAPRNARTD